MKKIIIFIFIINFFLENTTMATKNSLKEYRKQRDFSESPEPKGNNKTTINSSPFMIHKHWASHVHYDLRIKIGNTLKSWAVPKGPSTKTSIKRLAILVEDHPLEYANFEGTIQQDQYGGGTVMIWDEGTFHSIREKNGALVPIEESFKDGRIEILLDGKKLKGNYALIKTTPTKNWLLIKMDDEFANKRINQKIRGRSARTGRTKGQIEKQEK